MRLFLALLAALAVGCSSGPYFRARHEGITLEGGTKGAPAPPTAACDDQLRVIAARLRSFCLQHREEPRPVCVEIAAFEAWREGVRCFFRD